MKRFDMSIILSVWALIILVIAGCAEMDRKVPAKAGEFPSKHNTLICPWAAGGGTDMVSRALVKNAKKYFGVKVKVINKTGSLGIIGVTSQKVRAFRLLPPFAKGG